NCYYNAADPNDPNNEVSAPLKWLVSGTSEQFGEYTFINQPGCCGDDPNEVTASNSITTKCCKLGQSLDAGGNCITSSSSCTDTDSGAYPTRNYAVQGTVSVNSVPQGTDNCIDSTNLQEYYCQTETDLTASNFVYPCSNGCLNGECIPSVSCSLINAYWAVDPSSVPYPDEWVVMNNSDNALVVVGQNCPTTLTLNISIWESDDCTNPAPTPSGVSCATGRITFKKNTDAIINFGSNNKASVMWRSKTEADNDNDHLDASGFDSNEYYFMAHLINTQDRKLSQMMVVNSTPDPNNPPGNGGTSTCRDGNKQPNELCDPTASNSGCPSGWTCNIDCNSCTVVSGGVRTVLIKSPCLEDSNPGDQFGVYHETTIKYNITTSAKISEVTGPDKQCLLSGKIKVPFFDWINFIVVIALIVGFYIVQHYRRNKNN
ncbi:hypothetical protein HYX18_01285, partial [Candidatus Woesearchaeota archaeon]|nr:hypothetical protein [Candidatus Woesearchaeota archaeon]